MRTVNLVEAIEAGIDIYIQKYDSQHDIYKSECCLSPIPSLAMHCTNINSIFGLSPNLDWNKLWEDNKNY